jgi:hypothetical protein
MPDDPVTIPAIHERSKSMRLMLYVAGFVSVQILFLLLAFVAASTPWFMTHDAYPGMLQAGYSVRLKQADCDIVLYGDSSALTGLDPDIIQTMTGLKACNLSEGVTIQGVVGSRFPLDTYLKNNKRPLYLLAMYTPSLFRPYVDKFTDYQPEGVLYMLQYDRNREMLRGLLRRRRWVVNFDLWTGRQIVKDFLNRCLPGRNFKVPVDARAQRDSRHGIWPFPVPPETDCVRTAYHLLPSEFARHADSVAEMRSIYGVDGTTVLVNISPVATCDALQQTYRDLSAGLHDNLFESLPISDFNEGDVHFSADGSRHISVEAGGQILALEKRRWAGKPVTNGTAGHPE